MTLKAAASLPTNDRDWQRWCIETHDLNVLFGFGSPEGVVTSTPGKLYLNKTGGAGVTLWIKETGDSNTGWVSV